MTGLEILVASGAVVGLMGAVFGVWKFIDAKLTALRIETEAKLGLLREQMTALTDTLHLHRLHVAETYATKAGVSESATMFSKVVTDMGDQMNKRLDGMSSRLDRVIEMHSKPSRSRSEN